MNFKPKGNKWNRLSSPCWYIQPSKSCWASLGFRHGGVGFISQSAWTHLEKDDNFVEAIWANKVHEKPLEVAWGTQDWTLESNKHNQTTEMDAISKYHHFEIIHGQYVSKLKLFFYIVYIF